MDLQITCADTAKFQLKALTALFTDITVGKVAFRSHTHIAIIQMLAVAEIHHSSGGGSKLKLHQPHFFFAQIIEQSPAVFFPILAHQFTGNIVRIPEHLIGIHSHSNGFALDPAAADTAAEQFAGNELFHNRNGSGRTLDDQAFFLKSRRNEPVAVHIINLVPIAPHRFAGIIKHRKTQLRSHNGHLAGIVTRRFDNAAAFVGLRQNLIIAPQSKNHSGIALGVAGKLGTAIVHADRQQVFPRTHRGQRHHGISGTFGIVGKLSAPHFHTIQISDKI